MTMYFDVNLHLLFSDVLAERIQVELVAIIALSSCNFRHCRSLCSLNKEER